MKKQAPTAPQAQQLAAASSGSHIQKMTNSYKESLTFHNSKPYLNHKSIAGSSSSANGGGGRTLPNNKNYEIDGPKESGNNHMRGSAGTAWNKNNQGSRNDGSRLVNHHQQNLLNQQRQNPDGNNLRGVADDLCDALDELDSGESGSLNFGAEQLVVQQEQSLSMDPNFLNGIAQDGQGQIIMMQGGQGQGQGQQSQNASAIMQNNMSANDFGGFMDEPSGIEALERASSDEIQPIFAQHHSQTSQHNQHNQLLQQNMRVEQSRQNYRHASGANSMAGHQAVGATRTNEYVQNKNDPLAEAKSLKHVLCQLELTLGISAVHSKVQNLLQAAFKHQSNLSEALAAEKQAKLLWKQSYKEKVRVKLTQFKKQKKQELREAEEMKFEQQKNEFDLQERVSSLEQGYSRQAEEINKQANDNEILKFEKIKLIQQHSKRLSQIESALAKIQIQKSGGQPDHRHLSGEWKPAQADVKQTKITQVRDSKTAGATAISRTANHFGTNERAQKPHMPPDSQPDKKRNGADLSKSFCIGETRPRQDCLENSNSLLLKMQGSKGNPSVGTQLSNLKMLIKEFKHLSDQQRREEVKINDFQESVDPKKLGAEPSEQPSLSDVDFGPQREMMNNFFTSQKEEDSEVNTKKQSSGDANRAVIMGDSNSSRVDDPDIALGDLAQQLNDTSFFAGQNGGLADIQLPDNLNFFSKGDDEIDFHPKGTEDEKVKMTSFLDEDLLLNTSGAFKEKEAPKNEIQDSDDKDVEELFRDSSDSVADQLESFKRQLESKIEMGDLKDDRHHESRPCPRDVNLSDLMQASGEINFKVGDGKSAQGDFMKHLGGKDSADLSPIEIHSENKDQIVFSDSNVMALPDRHITIEVGTLKASEVDLSIVLPDLSAIVSEAQNKSLENEYAPGKEANNASEDDQNLADLNRKLMPNFILCVGEKQIKMPRLDLDRVLGLLSPAPFRGNLADTQTNNSLETDTILQTHKDMKGVGASQTSGGSFLNETGSKQVQSELQTEQSKSKQKEQQSGIDYLNECDLAISAIIEDVPFDDRQEEIKVLDDIDNHVGLKKGNVVEVEAEEPINLLDSLREEIEREEELKGNRGEEPSPEAAWKSPDSMPFELRDSFKSKLTDSNKMRQSVVTCVHRPEKRSLSQIGQVRQSASVEEQDDAKTQLRPMQKNEFTMSQKEFDKKSQMMRLSELDSVSNHLHNKSQKGEVTRTQKIAQLPAGRIVGENLQQRNRAPSENQALERQYQNQKSSDNGGKLASPRTITNGTDSMVGSLQTQSALGEKSRLSAPVTIPARGHRAQVIPRESAYTTEVVNEVEDDDSKIISVNNSSSKLVSDDKQQEHSITMLAYNSAYPHTTKNIRQLKSHESSQRSSSVNQPAAQQKKTKVSIQRVQHNAEMSSLIKNQQKSSSSIQKLKVVKKVSVSSAAAPAGGKSGNNKRDILSSSSIERPSVGGNSSHSLVEQSRIARVNATSENRDYASVAQESSNPRLSINTRKQKPITVSFKNIVKASIQKRRTSNAPVEAKDGDKSSHKRDDSEKPGSVINLQRVACNPAVAKSQGSNMKPGKISVSGKGEGKTLNITVMRNQKPKNEEKSSAVVKQIIKLNNANSSVDETRDGSIIFVGNRIATIEKAKAKRDVSHGTTNAETENEDATQKRQSGKLKTKMLIQASQIKQRKLSIGSANAAASILKQNLQESGSRPGVVSGSLAQTEASRVGSPSSPRRLSSQSAGIKMKVKNQNQPDSITIEEQKIKPKTVKKGSIISLKRRDAPVTEGSQHISSSNHLGVVRGQRERVPSVGTEGNQSSKRSGQTDAPNLKIKRMTKSKNQRGGSTRPQTVIRQENHHYTCVNQTAVLPDSTQLGHESLVREFHTNQSNTVLGDISLLSKIGGADSRSQIMVMPNLNCGHGGGAAGQKAKQNILINQSSQQNLPSQFYDASSVSTSFQTHGAAAKSAAGGKRIGLSRGSIETSMNAQQQVNQSQVVTSGDFMPTISAKDVATPGAPGGQQQHMQISQKAMKIISSQKSKISGAQRQVQMEWKTTGMQQSSSTSLQVGKHRNSAAPTTDSKYNQRPSDY